MCRLQTYYSTASVKELKGNWCHNCYQDEKRDYLDVDGQRIKKMDIIKRKNDGEQEEAWVECDSCNRWVHQICGLFNKGRNNKDVCYLCPDCLCQGMPPPATCRIPRRTLIIGHLLLIATALWRMNF